jgi:CRP-like cAMP-binding protein
MDTLADELQRVPLFSSLSARQRKRLARDFKEREFRPGTAIVRQGQMSGNDFFVIAEGEASVSANGREIGRLTAGDHFGEVALIGERVRQATVTAETPLRCLVMASWDFRAFVKEHPDVSWKLLQYLVGVLADERGRDSESSLRAG